MKEVNIQKELDHLDNKKISEFLSGSTDGKLIKKTDMSEYIKECYGQSTIVECPVKEKMNYKYYFDNKNKTCILFTSSCTQDYLDENEIALKTDTIIVKIYISEKDFMFGTLAFHCFFHLFDRDKNYWGLDEGCMVTDCIEFNECPLVIAITKLSERQPIARMNTIYDIINS